MESKQDKIRLYFLGSGKIAVPVLHAIASSDFIELVGVGTQEDQPSGRKKKLQPTPVGAWAGKHDVVVDKPNSVNNTFFLDRLKSLSPDFVLVVSFGQLLKEKILSLPKHGCINIHASLLPKYRGASPIIASILNGDTVVGVAIMKMEKGLDTGPVFATFKHNMAGTENTEKLELILGELAAKNIEGVLRKVHNKELRAIQQDHSKATYAGKISKQDGKLNWQLSAVEIERMIRAYYPWPGAYFYLNIENDISQSNHTLNMDLNGQSGFAYSTSCNKDKRKKVQITEAVVCENKDAAEPGQTLRADKRSWVIACGTEALEIKKLIPEGKKEMTGADFIRGNRIKEVSLNNRKF
jgi:methionyl-tRNA formyltransferase